MDLQADDAALLDGVVRLGIIDSLLAVNPKLNVFALAADQIVIPIVALQNPLEFSHAGFSKYLLSP